MSSGSKNSNAPKTWKLTELYNLADDPGETMNLIEKNPERANQLSGYFEDALEPLK